MKRIIALTFAVLPIIAFSADKTILCGAPEGSRIDYFTFNSLNLQNETFLMGRDRVSGMRPRIILSANNRDVFFTIGDAAEVKGQPKTGKMQVLAYNDEQISFTGVVNGAPILATYYPKMNILIYSQQSIWPGPNYQGARAVIFYSKCQTES